MTLNSGIEDFNLEPQCRVQSLVREWGYSSPTYPSPKRFQKALFSSQKSNSTICKRRRKKDNPLCSSCIAYTLKELAFSVPANFQPSHFLKLADRLNLEKEEIIIMLQKYHDHNVNKKKQCEFLESLYFCSFLFYFICYYI